LVLAAIALAGRAAAVEQPRISNVRPLEDRPYLVVDVEYPKAWAETSFTVEADGKAVPARALGGGFDPESNLATYLVFPGAACKKLAARWDGPRPGRTPPAKLAWKAPALAVLLDRLGTRDAVLQPGALEFQVFPPATARFFQGGAELGATAVEGRGPGRRVRVTPRWAAGLNTVQMVVAGPAPTLRDFTFVLLDGGGLEPGATAQLVYGTVGGKSGPFYELDVVGEALRVGQTRFATTVTADAEGWLLDSQVLAAPLEAVAPGEATLRILRKGHFLEGFEPFAEHRIRVGPAAASTGGGLARDPVEDDPRYAEAFAKIDAEVDAALADHPQRGGEGFCNIRWETKKRMLKTNYGIDWRSPADMNPHVIFD
jgi:hypothetical protein